MKKLKKSKKRKKAIKNSEFRINTKNSALDNSKALYHVLQE